MGLIKRQSIKATLATYVGIGIAYISIIFIWPLCLTTEQVGLLRFLTDIAGVIAIFIRFGTPQSAIKFFPMFNNPEKQHNGLFFNLMFFPLLFFIVFAVVFLFTKDMVAERFFPDSPLIRQYFIWLLPFTFFTVYMNSVEVYSNLHMRIVVPVIIKEILQRLLITGAVVFFYYHIIGFDSLVGIYTFIFGSSVVFTLMYIARLKRLYWKPNWKFFTPGLKKDLLRYSVAITIGGIGSVLISKIDTIMVTSMTNLASIGIYSTAALIALVVEMPKRSINQISGPVVSEYLSTNNIEKLGELYKKTSVTQTIAGIFIFLVIWLSTDNLFAIMPDGKEYAAGKFVIFYIALSKIFDMLTSINAIIINNSRYYIFSIYSMVFLGVLGIVTNYLLIPRMGLTGAALATAISILSYNLLCVGFVYIKYGIHPFSSKTGVVLLIGVLCYGFYYLPLMFNPYVDTVLRSGMVTVVYCGLIYVTKVSADVNALVPQTLHWIKSKLGKNG